jgi:outer membrane lipoprotein-sorting protein
LKLFYLCLSLNLISGCLKQNKEKNDAESEAQAQSSVSAIESFGLNLLSSSSNSSKNASYEFSAECAENITVVKTTSDGYEVPFYGQSQCSDGKLFFRVPLAVGSHVLRERI